MYYKLSKKEEMYMFMKNGKKKTHPLMAISIGAMAVYGAYSIVHCMKESCVSKCQIITKVFKNKENKEKKAPKNACDDNCSCDNEC